METAGRIKLLLVYDEIGPPCFIEAFENDADRLHRAQQIRCVSPHYHISFRSPPILRAIPDPMPSYQALCVSLADLCQGEA